MAETDIHAYSSGEKLNKMDVDVIDVTVEADVDNAGAGAAGDLLFKVTEIPNAVSVNGGTCIVQSIGILDEDFHGAAIDIVFMDTSALLDAGDDGGTIDAADGSIPDAILGVVTISSYFNGVAWKYGHKENIGLVLKAASTTKTTEY